MSSQIAPPAAPLRAIDLLQRIHDTPAGLALAELLALHTGMLARDGLRPSEFRRVESANPRLTTPEKIIF